MKTYIEHQLTYRHSNKGVANILSHLFCTLGGGSTLNPLGYFSANYRGQEVYEFGEPQPLSSIYPWSDTEKHQPFRNLAGCRDVGFRETAEHFLKCLAMTPTTVNFIKPWLQNIDLVREVLLDTPTIEDEFTIDDMDKFIEEISGEDITLHAPEDGTILPENNSVKKVWFFDVQWSDTPNSVMEEVSYFWSEYGLGNDDYIRKVTLDSNLFESNPRTYFWLKYKGVSEGERVLIHYWW